MKTISTISDLFNNRPSKTIILIVTDIHNDKVRINLKNIGYYYEQGVCLHIYTNSGCITATDITIEELDNLFEAL